MNSLDIIQYLLPMAAVYAGYKWGHEVGYDRGNAEGRKSVRKHYEQAGR